MAEKAVDELLEIGSQLLEIGSRHYQREKTMQGWDGSIELRIVRSLLHEPDLAGTG